MAANDRCGGLDYFKLAAAFLVVAIHTSPLAIWSVDADFILTRVIARVAVPFFLMISGYFVLAPYLSGDIKDTFALGKFIKKTALLYGLASLIYLIHPLVIIAIRVIGEALSLTPLVVDNSIVHYLLVGLASLLFAGVVVKLTGGKRASIFPHERAWIEVNLAHLHHNINVLHSLLPADCQLMPAVKADAYGLGAVAIARALAADGIRCCCVASLSEALELRRAKIPGDILILGYTHPADFPLLKKYDLVQTVLDYHYAQELNDCGLKLRVHLKIDTGMHRQGERDDNFNTIKAIFAMQSLQIEGMYTHLAMADSIQEQDIAYTQRQLAHFTALVERLRAEGIAIPALHAQSSYGIINYRQLHYAYARPGIALYGAIDSEHVRAGLMPQLKPVFALKSRISTVKELAPGEGAGYDLAYTAKSAGCIAILAIGYADGIPRSLSEKQAYVLVNGQRAPIIGKICMDQMMIDISQIAPVRPNDIATIIGQDGQECITAVEFATWDDTIANEILSRLGKRLARIYQKQ